MQSEHKIHVVHVVANHEFVHYLNWFAERVHKYPDIKFSVVVMYPVKPRMLDDLRIRGCDCYWIKYDKRFKMTWMMYAFLKLCILFNKLKPNVVNTHLFYDSLVGLLAARITGVKKRIIWKQDTGYRWYYNRSWVWGDKLNNINATTIIVNCEEAKQFLLEKEKAPSLKVHLIHNGIPLAQYTNQTIKDKEDFINQYELKDKIVIGTISRYIEWKGYRYIIEAAKTLVKKYPNLKFLFIGFGPQKEELESLVKQNALEKYIIFTGFIYTEQKPSIYGIMDIFLHASFMEPFGYAFIEAMANGVPIVTTKTGIAGDVLEHKFTCYFTGYKDPQGIINGIEWMLENPELRKAMGVKLKKIAIEKFNVDTMLDEHIRIYRGLANVKPNLTHGEE